MLWRMTAWIALGISFLSLLISFLGYLRGRPNVRVTGDKVVLVGSSTSGPAIIVSATNVGGAAARVRHVSLHAVRGGGFSYFVAREDTGPDLPVELAAHGGSATWSIDYARLRSAVYGAAVRDRPVALRATVTIGNKVYKQRGYVGVPPEGEYSVPVPWRERLRGVVGNWVRPQVGWSPFVSVNDIDLALGTIKRSFSNTGNGLTRKVKLTLVMEESDGRKSRVEGVEPLYIPRMLPRRSASVVFPLVDDTTGVRGARYWWSVTDGRATGSGYGATTVTEARELVAQHNQRSAPHS